MRPEKESMLRELSENTKDSVFVLFADFTGINVPQSEAFRNSMREQDAKVKLAKNRMLRLIARDMGLEDEMSEHLKGSTGIIYGDGEISAVAKEIQKFVKEHEIATIKMGAMEGAFLSREQVIALSKLPSRDELLGQVLGCFLAPAQNLANLLNNSMGELAGLLKAYEDKLSED